MTTNVYIDGFNLYYRALKGTPGARWLDVESLCAKLLPGHDIQRIRYFTAKVKPQANNPQIASRQQVYLRALGTLPTVTIHYGRYTENTTRMGHANPPPNTVEVIKREEKGSDVNLAAYLMLDSFRNEADTFVVITNDSDLAEPLRLVRTELGKKVGLINPADQFSKALLSCRPTFQKQIRKSAVLGSQFPDKLTDKNGKTLTKPARWL